MTDTPLPPPAHIAIIMDGNGRWAKERGLPRTMGHRKGAEALKSLLASCKQQQIKYLTLYAFSSENWSRPETEVNDLMGLLNYYLEKEAKLLIEHGIRLRVIGDLSLCSEGLRKQIAKAVEQTAALDAMNLTIALSYGSRQEMLQAIRRITETLTQQGIPPADINEAMVEQYLYTHGLPDPDLLIRTGGEQRLSNFLLWQCAYTELYFTETYWPDFTGDDLKQAIHCYHGRERRYGTV